ncbi:P-loop containing nucleoside triphosphate hydrolase protein [Thelephora terrestris]|uniref:P-loop containing nucleoside triphosphate hydrolase protein n=1 Tax=Thelephora terrestris TaxID=56493 RepID=A0A9P6H608_9AGAM|nr:P-loop containing nucleoside triphosphate hydrolase protein [Thelephora terrestris]
MSDTRPTERELEEAFIKITFRDEREDQNKDRLYTNWTENASEPWSDPFIFATNQLRKLYPGHTVVASQSGVASILGFPAAYVQSLRPDLMISENIFVPFARRMGTPGALVERVSYGCFQVAWEKYDFKLFVTTFLRGYGQVAYQFIVHEGTSEQPSKDLLIAAGGWAQALHDEIWVFNQGFWDKDPGLWEEVQKANWKDVILDEDFKATLQKDVFGFFSSERVYLELQIPWKRGIVMYGPPGNGKTISIKAIMKGALERGYSPLYVKSFKSWAGEEFAMSQVFRKARAEAPCVLILEDLDSLINDSNRSFFLNQLDGLENNDGLLVIGSTNHYDRLDPAITKRPSRFDRKFLFDKPTHDERVLYLQYWQKKLRHNKDISFSDALKDQIADLTYDFSFAYLKEAFVSALVLLATYDSVPKPTFEEMIKKQIAALRKQLDETETKPSVLGYAPQESTLAASRELQHPSQVHESQIPKSGGTADFGSFKRDIQNRAKTAVAYGRSFIA